MTPLRITIVLTVLAAVVVALTRVRLGRNNGEAAGRLSIPRDLLNTHTTAGVVAIGLWSAFLVTGIKILGWVALPAWWTTVAAGLLILLRWMPAKGRHSSGPVADTWGEGPGLSVLAHLGMLVGALVFTALMVVGKLP
ncbi:MAG: hypothetical protein ACRDPJ_05555 [Nocardioidaceae bacterium]